MTMIIGNTFMTIQASMIWNDIQNSIVTGAQLADRQVRSQIGIETTRPWVFGINLVESHRGTTHFRLWRFYPGPPAPGGVE